MVNEKLRFTVFRTAHHRGHRISQKNLMLHYYYTIVPEKNEIYSLFSFITSQYHLEMRTITPNPARVLIK